jgi:hypothetical protein
MNLLGTWIIDETDKRALTKFGDVVMEFHDDGNLTYTIRAKDKTQIIKLIYWIEGATLVTDQPIAQKVERTAFQLTDDGKLVLFFEGVPYRFRRSLWGKSGVA